MPSKEAFDKPMGFGKLLLTNFLDNIPIIALGIKWRYLLYRAILCRLTSSVYITHSLEILGASYIAIEDSKQIFNGWGIGKVRQHNKSIDIVDKVGLPHQIDLRSLDNTYLHIDEASSEPYVFIISPRTIKIIPEALLSFPAALSANNHNYLHPRQKIAAESMACQEVVIEDDCWVGNGVIILSGVTIGRGSIIASGSLVTNDIPRFSVAAGVPARIIKSC